MIKYSLKFKVTNVITPVVGDITQCKSSWLGEVMALRGHALWMTPALSTVLSVIQ